MQTVLDRFPDRKIEVLHSWVASGAEFAEYRWTGTPVDGGETRELIFATLLELDGDRLRRGPTSPGNQAISQPGWARLGRDRTYAFLPDFM